MDGYFVHFDAYNLLKTELERWKSFTKPKQYDYGYKYFDICDGDIYCVYKEAGGMRIVISYVEGEEAAKEIVNVLKGYKWTR